MPSMCNNWQLVSSQYKALLALLGAAVLLVLVSALLMDTVNHEAVVRLGDALFREGLVTPRPTLATINNLSFCTPVCCCTEFCSKNVFFPFISQKD